MLSFCTKILAKFNNNKKCYMFAVEVEVGSKSRERVQIYLTRFCLEIETTEQNVISGTLSLSHKDNRKASFALCDHSPCPISDPTGREIPARVTPIDAHHARAEFVPTEVGGHLISVQYGGQNVIGSPFTSYTYDASRIKIIDVDQHGTIGQEMGFTGK